MALTKEEDRDLVERCLQGKESAWREMEALHGGLMRRAALARTRDRAQAEEACQRIWTRLSTDSGRALGAFQGRCSLGTWLAAVALNEAAHLAQAEARLRSRERLQTQSPEIPAPIQTLCAAEDAERLREAMEALPTRDRLLLTLVYWDRIPHRDAAGVLGVSEKSIPMLLQRARERLREKFGVSL